MFGKDKDLCATCSTDIGGAMIIRLNGSHDYLPGPLIKTYWVKNFPVSSKDASFIPCASRDYGGPINKK